MYETEFEKRKESGEEPHTVHVGDLRRQRQLRNFLTWWTAGEIREKLGTCILGQPELLRDTADFLRYHALRQLYPELPMRPLMITGPSGSGKTQIWREVRRRYQDLFPVTIADCSCLSCEGWSGSYKVGTFLDERLARGGILVLDEFDKLVKPVHSSQGDNVSLQLQGELLKLMEGEFQKPGRSGEEPRSFRKIGLVLVGAFSDLKPAGEARPLGFFAQAPEPRELCPRDFTAYGMMPELLGRIAVHCPVRPLSQDALVEILQCPESRVGRLLQALGPQGIFLDSVISQKELRDLARQAGQEGLGARWACAQMETRLLEEMRERRFNFPEQSR